MNLYEIVQCKTDKGNIGFLPYYNKHPMDDSNGVDVSTIWFIYDCGHYVPVFKTKYDALNYILKNISNSDIYTEDYNEEDNFEDIHISIVSSNDIITESFINV